jgi:hypothetical protein
MAMAIRVQIAKTTCLAFIVISNIFTSSPSKYLSLDFPPHNF